MVKPTLNGTIKLSLNGEGRSSTMVATTEETIPADLGKSFKRKPKPALVMPILPTYGTGSASLLRTLFAKLTKSALTKSNCGWTAWIYPLEAITTI